MKRWTPAITTLALIIGLVATLPAAENTLIASPPANALGTSVENEVRAAIDRSLDWLAANQKENGSWSNSDYPALTGLALQAFLRGDHPNKKVVVKKAVDFITTCVQKDGGIYKIVKGRKGGGLSNYNTAICMTALYETGDRKLMTTVLNGRKFIAGAQHFGDDVYKGGFGYDKNTERAYADLLNTYYSVKGMKDTAGAEDFRPTTEKRVEIDWAETVKFIESMQNKEGSGAGQRGGFPYKPGESKAGDIKKADGTMIYRSYGSMTYAGLLAMIYANVDRDDVRVRAAFDWAQSHWTLKENPGMGAQGLYFFFNVMTKSLAAYGTDVIKQKDGKLLNWRTAVAKRVLGAQKMDTKGKGYWVNNEARFWENDPILATSYSVLALEALLEQ